MKMGPKHAAGVEQPRPDPGEIVNALIDYISAVGKTKTALGACIIAALVIAAVYLAN